MERDTRICTRRRCRSQVYEHVGRSREKLKELDDYPTSPSIAIPTHQSKIAQMSKFHELPQEAIRSDEVDGRRTTGMAMVDSR